MHSQRYLLTYVYALMHLYRKKTNKFKYLKTYILHLVQTMVYSKKYATHEYSYNCFWETQSHSYWQDVTFVGWMDDDTFLRYANIVYTLVPLLFSPIVFISQAVPLAWCLAFLQNSS